MPLRFDPLLLLLVEIADSDQDGSLRRNLGREAGDPRQLRGLRPALSALEQNERKLAERLGSAEVRLGGNVWSLPNG